MEDLEEKVGGQATGIDKALLILTYLATDPLRGYGVRELAKEVMMTKSTTHRLLAAMLAHGFVQQDPVTQHYRIGLKAVEIGLAGLAGMTLMDVAPAYLREMVNRTGETCFLAVLENGEIVYLYKVEGTRSIRTSSNLGSRRPVHCTALGKSMLSTLPDSEVLAILNSKGMAPFTRNTISDPQAFVAHLQQVREQGYALDNEEIEEGLMCIGAPIYDLSGRAAAAMSVAGPIARIEPNLPEYTELIVKLAGNISRSLGYVPAVRRESPTL